MSEAIESARAMIKARIDEIDVELAKLHAALTSLDGERRQVGGRAAAGRRKPRTRKRAPRGQRRTQLLAAVKKSPGATAAELGRGIGISTNQAHALAQRSVKDGAIRKRGKGYHPT